MAQVNASDVQVLYPGKIKWTLVTLTGLTFVAMGIFIIIKGEGLMGWIISLFFGLVALTGCSQLVGKGSSLTLAIDGFEVMQFGKSRGFIGWAECSTFGVAQIGSTTLVVYDRLGDEGKMIASINQAIAGSSASLGDTYGKKAIDLAELMNAYRRNALGKQSG
jgi:hypothetical protein